MTHTDYPAVSISAFSPIGFTFRILERDFLGVSGPLFVAAILGHLDWLILEVGSFDYAAGLLICGLWVPIGSFFGAGMLRFGFKVARGQPYGYRDLWLVDTSVLRLALLKLWAYAATGVSMLAVVAALPREDAEGEDWLAAIPQLAPQLGLPGQIAIFVLLFAGWIIGPARTLVAGALIVDERIGVWPALLKSYRLTRGHTLAIVIYGIIVSMIAGVVATISPTAILAAVGTPGVVYLALTLRGEFVG